MWPLRDLADAAEDFADAAEEAVLLLTRIRTASGRAARASVTAVSIILAGVRDVTSILLAGVRDVAYFFAPVVVRVAKFLTSPRPKPSRQERRRKMRDDVHEARKRERENQASVHFTAVQLKALLQLWPRVPLQALLPGNSGPCRKMRDHVHGARKCEGEDQASVHSTACFVPLPALLQERRPRPRPRRGLAHSTGSQV